MPAAASRRQARLFLLEQQLLPDALLLLSELLLNIGRRLLFLQRFDVPLQKVVNRLEIDRVPQETGASYRPTNSPFAKTCPVIALMS